MKKYSLVERNYRVQFKGQFQGLVKNLKLVYIIKVLWLQLIASLKNSLILLGKLRVVF